MATKPEKLVCHELRCMWHGLDTEVLRAPNPFQQGDELWGCPVCRDVGTLMQACDEPDCWELTTCGTNTPFGYRRTCGKHRPKNGN